MEMRRGNLSTTSTLLCLALLGAASNADPAGAEGASWREFHSRAAGFRVEVPAEPLRRYSEDRTLAGKVVHHHYIVELPAARFDFERIDLPVLASFFYSPTRLLERAKDDYLEELDAVVESVEAIEVQGYPGLRLLFRHRAAGSAQEETRFILAGRYLYMVSAGPFLPEVRSSMVERVFSTFRICLDGPPACAPADAAAPSDRPRESPRGSL
jgi:hypothetical protein